MLSPLRKMLKEFRVVLPMTVEEYQIAQLFAVAEASREQTQGEAGVEVLKNEPYDNEHGKGQYTHKIYHLGSRIPRALTSFIPESALQVVEEAWNGYPHCKTVLTNKFLGEKFHLIVESRHEPDDGKQENVHKLDEASLKHREVVFIDIATDHVDPKDYKPEYDPTLYHSEKTGRGPLQAGWQEKASPIMCCYKLVTLKFKVFGFESMVSSFVAKFQQNLFTVFHRQVFCSTDKWYGMTMEDIRELEVKIKHELDEKKKERDALQATKKK